MSSIVTFLKKLIEQTGFSGEKLDAARGFLSDYYFVFLVALGVLWIIFLIPALPAAVRRLKRISAKVWVLVLAVFCLALALRLFFVPHQPQVFYDEISFLDVARNFAKTGVFEMTSPLFGTRGDFLPCPAGWEFLISLVFRFISPDNDSAFLLSAIISSLTIPVMFIAGYLFFASESAGIFAALGLAVLPIHLRLAGSSEMETASVFFLLITLVSFLLYFEEKSLPLFYFSCLSAAWALNIRQEAWIIFPPVLILFFLFHGNRALSGVGTFHKAVGIFLIFVFLFPAFLSSFYGLSTGFYYFYESPEQVRQHVMINISNNIVYFFRNAIHPAAITLFSLAGLAFLMKRRRREAIFFLLWLVLFYAFYSLNPSCDFSLIFSFDGWRTAIHLLIPVLLLSGYGCAALIESASTLRVIAIPACLALSLFFLYIPYQFNRFLFIQTPPMARYSFAKECGATCPMRGMLVISADEQLFVRDMMRREWFGLTGKYPEVNEDNLEWGHLPPHTRFQDNMRKYLGDSPDRMPVYVFYYSGSFSPGLPRFGWYAKNFDYRMIRGYSRLSDRATMFIFRLISFKRPLDGD